VAGHCPADESCIAVLGALAEKERQAEELNAALAEARASATDAEKVEQRRGSLDEEVREAEELSKALEQVRGTLAERDGALASAHELEDALRRDLEKLRAQKETSDDRPDKEREDLGKQLDAVQTLNRELGERAAAESRRADDAERLAEDRKTEREAERLENDQLREELAALELKLADAPDAGAAALQSRAIE